MSAYIDPRFRTTPWPGVPVPLPHLHPMPLARVEGDDWIIWPIAPESRQAVELPADFYLQELMELPIGDLEAAAGLLRQYGLLFDLNLRDLDTRSFDSGDLAEIEAIPDFYEKVDGVPHGGVHRDLVNLHVTTAREAITTWLALQRPGGLDALVDQEATEEELARFNTVPGNKPLSMEEFRRLCLDSRPKDLQSIVDGALSKFSIGLRDLSERWPTVYSVSFLQLYNHLVEKAEFRQCANEPCGKTFVRQRGRAEFGQHRTSGILYCSRDCARAQAQRQLRRRRKAEQVGSVPAPSREQPA